MLARRPNMWLPVALLIPTLALSLAATGDGTLPGDVRLARWLQAHPIPLAEPLTAFTNDYAAGTPLTVAGIALALALLAARLPDAALLVAVATAIRATNGLVKTWIDSPRPTPDLITVTERATGLGFPSGHAMGSTLVLGAVMCVISSPPRPRLVIAVACLALILLTGYGRIFVGAHWPSDVLGGYLWGALLLLLARRLTRAARGRIPSGRRPRP